MVRKVTKRPFAIRLAGRKARQPTPAIASQSAMVQVDLLVPLKRQAIRQHFATQVAERSRPQPRMVSVRRSARRAAVAWVLQDRLAITLPFVTQVGAQLDRHPVVEPGRPFGIAQDVRRDHPAATDDEWLKLFKLFLSNLGRSL